MFCRVLIAFCEIAVGFHSHDDLYANPCRRLKCCLFVFYCFFVVFVHFLVPEKVYDNSYKIIKDKIKTNK